MQFTIHLPEKNVINNQLIAKIDKTKIDSLRNLKFKLRKSQRIVGKEEVQLCCIALQKNMRNYVKL